MQEQFPGLLPDPRPEEKKELNYQHREFYSAIPITWEEKNSYKTYSIRNQDGSSSCVAQATAKLMEILTGVVDSAHPTYSRRSNAPSEGMWLQDAGALRKSKGTTTEALCVSQNMNEQQMNAPVSLETPALIGAYIFVPLDIDLIAQAIEIHKGVVLSFNSNYQEWTDVPKVNGEIKWGHCVCAVDYILYKGEKALLIEDSWGKITTLGSGGQRIITESFLKARGTGAMYFLLPVPVTTVKPHYSLNKDLSYGMMHDEQVKNLQDMLKYDGSMPSSIPSTGNFLSATKQAVMAFQTKYAIANPTTGFCGPLTRAKLQLLFV